MAEGESLSGPEAERLEEEEDDDDGGVRVADCESGEGGGRAVEEA